MAASQKHPTLKLQQTSIAKLEDWSREFRLSRHSIIERSLLSLDVVIVILEKFREAKAVERSVREKMGCFQPGDSFPTGWGFVPKHGSFEIREIKFNLPSQADKVLDGIANLLDMTKSQVIDGALQIGAIEAAIRKELNSPS